MRWFATDKVSDEKHRNSHEEVRSRCLSESSALLAHATTKSLSVSDDVVSCLTKSQEIERNCAWNSDLEAQFWNAARQLSAATYPVTAENIESTHPAFGTPTLTSRVLGTNRCLSMAQHAERRTRSWTLLVVLVVLFWQIYWFFGQSLTDEYKEIRSELAKVSESKSMTDSELEKRTRLAAVGRALNKINFLPFFKEKEAEQLNTDIQPSEEPTPAVLARTPIPTEITRNQQIELFIMENQLQVIYGYFLPILYGWLGACVYVLRSLSAEIRNLRYALVSDTYNRIRMYLGALIGLAVVALWDQLVGTSNAIGVLSPNSGKTVANSAVELTPMAFAFVAGYSVEMFFFTIDRLIATFTASEVHVLTDGSTVRERRSKDG